MPISFGGDPAPPSRAPTLGPPANLVYEELSSGPTFGWTYNSGGAVAQTGYAFYRLLSGGRSPAYWNAGTSAWQSIVIYNSGSGNSITFPSASWADGQIYNWSVSTEDANGYGPFASPFTVTGQAPPVVTVTAPSGSIATAQPTVAWTMSFPTPGTSQSGYRVIIYNSTQYSAGGFTPGSGPSVYDSGVQGSAYTTSLSLANPPGGVDPVYLPDSTSYRAYVQVSTSGTQLSAWAYHAFATSFTAPSTPTITATATNDSITGCPKITLVVTGTAYSSIAPECYILRSDGLYVRGASAANPGQTNGSYVLTIDDYEVVPATAYTYTATTLVVVSPSVTVISAPQTSSPATIPGGQGWWEVNPLDYSTAINAQLVSFNPQVTEQSTARLVMGQPQPNVIANAMGKTDGTGSFHTFTTAVYAGLENLLQSQQTVFISNPYGDPVGNGIDYVRFGPQTGAMDTGAGNTVKSADLQASTASAPYHVVAVTWVAAARPLV